MKKEKSFQDILIDRILKTEIGPSPAQDVEDSSPAYLAYLMGELSSLRFEGQPVTQGHAHYAQVKLKPLPRTPHIFTNEQRVSFDLLKRWAPELSAAFSGRELKTVFRKLAKQFHPDLSRETGSSAKFHELKKAYDNLSTVF